jgi:branched-subunit amino acid transport protein
VTGEGALILIAGMALLTYASRAALLLTAPGLPREGVQRWLAFVPVALFTGLITTMVAAPGAPALDPPRLAALGVGVAVALLTRRVTLTILVGLAAWWIVRLVLLT